jgi:hypothetical protein
MPDPFYVRSYGTVYEKIGLDDAAIGCFDTGSAAGSRCDLFDSVDLIRPIRLVYNLFSTNRARESQ